MAQNKLNHKQHEAVEAPIGPVLVLAGAGAGKTKVIAERIKELVRQGVAPASILAITFTNKAAKEMRERVEKELVGDLGLNRPVSLEGRPFISTFHSLGVRVIREWSGALGLPKHFTIFDKDDSKRAVKEALAAAGLDPKTHEPERILGIISKEKGRDTTYEEYAARTENGEGGFFAGTVADVWREYERILARDKALDFDDLLLKTVRLLRGNPSAQEYYRKLWPHLLIDEYQDTNRVQYEIARLLTGKEQSVFVVGDIDQSIYSWRGADIRNILDFERDYPQAKVVILEENYRSTQNILSAANSVIGKNKLRREKNLFTANAAGERIGLFSAYDEAGEAVFIATKALEYIKAGTKAEEIAVLYRANFQSRALEEAFIGLSVPYQLVGTRFFERKEVKDILSYLRAALNEECLSDVKRVINTPPRGIGKSTVAKLFAGAEASLPASARARVADFRKLLGRIRALALSAKPHETLAFIISASGLESEWKESGEEGVERLENAYELAAFAERYAHLPPEEGVAALLAESALQSDQDELAEEKRGVRLMTVHASKGLEFDVVFVAGLEDGLFPHDKVRREGVNENEAEEERRLFYVAITRARKKVFLCYAQTRTIFGSREVNLPSEFIFDIPEELAETASFAENEVAHIEF